MIVSSLQVPLALALALALVTQPTKEYLSFSSTNSIYLTFLGGTGLVDINGLDVGVGGVTETLSIAHFLSPLHAEIIKLLNPNDSFVDASFRLDVI